MKYLLVDVHNVMHRAKWASKGDAFLKSGLSVHILLNSIRWPWQRFKADHVVFCGDSRSWRKDFYKKYKANRKTNDFLKTQTEIEEDKIFYDTLDNMTKFFEEQSNCTFLKEEGCEADDFIARWIHLFGQNPDNSFVIVSTDTDFHQLISPNVEIYDGVNKKHVTNHGVFNEKGQPYRDKSGNPMEPPNAEFALFEKCVRGDSTDNVPSAFPGVRLKGSKNKVGILDAFEDRIEKGWKWNSFMMQEWEDPSGQKHKVKDLFERNRILIDLSAQPDEIKDKLDNKILDCIQNPKNIRQIGLGFLKFCGRHELKTIADSPTSYIEFLSAPFKE